MNFILQIALKYLMKGLGPIDGWKTVIGLVLAVGGYLAKQYGVEIPVVDPQFLQFIGELLTAFGLGDKARKAVNGGKAIAG